SSAMTCGTTRDGLMRSLGRDQLHVDVDRLDARIGLDVAGDLVEDAPRVELRVGDHRNADRGALPLILVIDLRDGRVELLPDERDESPQSRAFLLERGATRNSKLVASDADEHPGVAIRSARSRGPRR